MEMVEIARIRREIKHQPRVNLDRDVIKSYADLVRDGKEFPPVKIVRDKDGVLWLWNGFHRVEAYEEAGEKEIPADVTTGDQRQAFKLSLGANAENGLHRSTADKQRAVKLALQDQEYVKFADSIIAEMCAVSAPMVSDIRKSLENDSKILRVDSRIGKDGRSYKYTPKLRIPKESNVTPKPQDGKATKEVVGTATKAGSVAEPEESETQPARSSSDPIKDPRGNPVPENLVDVFSDSVWGEIDATAKKLTSLIDRAASGPGGFYLTKDMENKNGSRRLTSFEAAKNSIFHCKPYGVCPACLGDGCKHCYQKGFLAKLTYKQVEGMVS